MNILCCLCLDVNEIGANHFQIDVRFTMLALIGPTSTRRQVRSHRLSDHTGEN